jgi:hypothetical protein
VYYYHGLVTLIVVPISVPSHFILFPNLYVSYSEADQKQVGRSSFFFHWLFICVLLSWPSNPNSCTSISAQSFYFIFPTCMCLIFMTQSHTSPIHIKAGIIMFYDDLYVSRYHEPITHE